MSIKSHKLYEKAISLLDDEKFDKAEQVFNSLLSKAQNEADRFEILIQYGGGAFFSGEYLKSYSIYKEAVELNKNEEVASLGFYLSCVKLDQLEEGLDEMTRFLKSNPPILYRDSIMELSENLKKGNAVDFTDIINKLKLKL